MRQEDMPTPETDAWVAKWDLWNSQNNWPDGLAGPISDVAHAKSLERRLALAVVALKEIRLRTHDSVAREALWVGLTGTEINHIVAANVGYPKRMMQEVEAKLKEKNGG